MLSPTHEIKIVGGQLGEIGLTIPESALRTYEPASIESGTKSLIRYAEESDPDVLVQITDPPVHGTIVGYVGKVTNTPAVYRYSGDRFYEYRVARGWSRLTEFVIGGVVGRLPLALADQFIALGPVGRRRLIARGVAPTDITILPPTIDIEPFETATPTSLDIPPDRHVALFVGRMSYRKGRQSLEAVIPRVLSEREDIQFVCVGSSDVDLDVPAGCQTNITLTGRVPPDIVPRYMRAADVLIHPSLTDGIPRVVLESLAAGTPVLARAVGDVASVTDNTFQTDEELVRKLLQFEELSLDSVAAFTRAEAGEGYRQFFRKFDSKVTKEN